MKYRVRGREGLFRIKKEYHKDNQVLVELINESNGGVYTAIADDLIPYSGKRKYKTKLPRGMKVDEDAQFKDIEGFGGTVRIK